MKKRIGVLMGGKSIEREVSFNSGRTVCDHLDSNKYDVVLLFQDHLGALYILPWYFLHRGKIADFLPRLESEATRVSWDELKQHIDFLYIAVHGRYAEDGTLQGMLEVLQIPYLGAKVFGSALGMNKAAQKDWLSTYGVRVPQGIVLSPSEIKKITIEQLLNQLQQKNITFPYVVKPVQEGSSLGVHVIYKAEEFLPALYDAMLCDQSLEQAVLVEEKLEGMEFTCIVVERYIDGKRELWPLSVTEIVVESGKDFLDYDQKYMRGRAKKRTPAHISSELMMKIQAVCVRVMELLHFETLARVDGFLTSQGDVVIIDPNSLSGMGPSSYIFNQAAVVGMNHSQFINYLIATELEHYGMQNTLELIKAEEEKNKDKQRIRVGVLLGGASNERETSLDSGRNVCYKLDRNNYDAFPIFISRSMELYKIPSELLIKNSTHDITECLKPEMRISWSDLPKLCDFAFIGLHGGKGEDGSVQGALEMLGLPYNGPGILTSALCMDKFKTNNFLRAKGFDVPVSQLITKEIWLEKDKELFFESFEKEFTYPCIIKPHDDGCSVMVHKVETRDHVKVALDEIFNSGKSAAMAEEYMVGDELTCGVMGNEQVVAFPPSKSVTHKGILTLEEKFLPGAGQNITPAPLSFASIKLVQTTMEQVYKTLGCKGYSRIDCFYQSADQSPTGVERVVILEVNTVPALTPATCLFHQAAEVGLRPYQFLDAVVKLGFEAHSKTARDVELSQSKKMINL